MPPSVNLLQGTLDLLILKALALDAMHGLGISRRIEQITSGTFQVKPGSLFPALHRMEEAGWLASSWGESENNRRAKFYQLTKTGRRQLNIEAAQWSASLSRSLAHSKQIRNNMRRFSNLWRNLIRTDQVEQKLDEEMRAYLDLLKEEKIRSGLDPQTAHRAALLELGGIEQVKESVRDVRAGRSLERFISDVRHAWRMILKMPLTAAVIVGSLGVGIGVNATVFSWIQAVVFEPLPGVARSGSIQHVEPRMETGSYPGVSWLEYRDLRESMGSFRDLLAFRMVPFYVGETGRTERIYGLLVSGNYFSTLGLSPALGRFIQPEDAARPGGERVVVISYEFWQTHLGASPGAIGQTIRLNGHPLTIIGVTPEKFQGTVLSINFSFWTPATLAPFCSPGHRSWRIEACAAIQ